ncbi:ADP-ribosylglycohydrolase family protein [Candidatus Woesearchaeota archaeon]|nr:ADP-ribosylglycohydrolase family protein [Candidatus Woesearchaeota archaeon]
MNQLQDKLKGMYIGAILGDALGRPIEFLDRCTIRRKFGSAKSYIRRFRDIDKNKTSDETSLLVNSIGYFNNPEESYQAHLGRLAERGEDYLRERGFSAKMRALIHHYREHPREQNPHTDNTGSGFVPMCLPLIAQTNSIIAQTNSIENLTADLYTIMDLTHREADKLWASHYFRALFATLKEESIFTAMGKPGLEELSRQKELRLVLSGNIEATPKKIDGSANNILPTALSLYVASGCDFYKMLDLSFSQFDTADYDTLFFCVGALIGASRGYKGLPRDLLDKIEGEIDVNGIDVYVRKSSLTKENIITSERTKKLQMLLSNEDILEEEPTELIEVIPELSLERSYNSRQPRHCYDLLEHTLRTVQAIPKEDYVLRLAALLHDVAKPFVRGEKEGRVHYHNHAKCGARMSYNILSRLGFPEEEKEVVCKLIEEHIINYNKNWSDAAVRRFVKRNCDILEKLFRLVKADNSAQLKDPRRGYDELTERIASLSS